MIPRVRRGMDKGPSRGVRQLGRTARRTVRGSQPIDVCRRLAQQAPSPVRVMSSGRRRSCGVCEDRHRRCDRKARLHPAELHTARFEAYPSIDARRNATNSLFRRFATYRVVSVITPDRPRRSSRARILQRSCRRVTLVSLASSRRAPEAEVVTCVLLSQLTDDLPRRLLRCSRP